LRRRRRLSGRLKKGGGAFFERMVLREGERERKRSGQLDLPRCLVFEKMTRTGDRRTIGM